MRYWGSTALQYPDGTVQLQLRIGFHGKADGVVDNYNIYVNPTSEQQERGEEGYQEAIDNYLAQLNEMALSGDIHAFIDEYTDQEELEK